MGEIMEKLLEVGGEAAIASYPILREQYVVYQLTGVLVSAAAMILAFFVVTGFFFLYGYEENKRYLTDPERYPEGARQAKSFLSNLKISIGFIVLGGTLLLLATFIRAVWCPDIVFLLNLIK